MMIVVFKMSHVSHLILISIARKGAIKLTQLLPTRTMFWIRLNFSCIPPDGPTEPPLTLVQVDTDS